MVISASVIAVQSLIIWGLTIWSIALLFIEAPTFYVSALFLVGLMLAAALWSSNIALGLIKLKRWAHTPGMVFQLLIASIGVASFGGEFGDVLIGLALLLPATMVFILLFSKDVRDQFQR